MLMERFFVDFLFRNLERYLLIMFLRYLFVMILLMNNFWEVFFVLVSYIGIKLWRKVNVWLGVWNIRNVERVLIIFCLLRFEFFFWRMNEINGIGSGEGVIMVYLNNFLYKFVFILVKIFLKFCRKKFLMFLGISLLSWLILFECVWFWRVFLI